LLLVLPENGVLRDTEHGLKPFYESLVPLIMLVFLFCGITYGWRVGKIKSDKDIARMAADSMNTMGAYIVLAFVAAQFVAYFSWSNLGLIVAISGADVLKTIGFSGIPLILSFILVTSFLNIFIGSASAKWAIMGPVFVPMLMLMGYSPELVQNAYRIGDSVTNIISPLLPYFPIIIAFAKKYDPRTGIGTLISIMLPYSIGFMILWSVMLIVWLTLGLPLGPDAPLYFTPPVSQ
jgi:aminobenzoyl-glutamate transport protein